MIWADEIIYPRICPVCMDIVTPWGKMICDTCRNRLNVIKEPYCMKCGRALVSGEKELCSDCMQRERAFERAIAGFDYGNTTVRNIIRQVKYHNQRQLLDYPCMVMAERWAETVKSWDCQCIIPVPVHKSRKKQRGFNQAEEIARRLGAEWGLKTVSNILYRDKKTAAQKNLNAGARLINLMNAFSADEERAKKYARVILADDIFTTGSTAQACTYILKKAGIKKVYLAVLSAGRNEI